MASTDVPIIDSHIHLYPSSELSTLAWHTPSNPIGTQHSLTEYIAATSSSKSSLEGFIFVETDRKHDLQRGVADGSGWECPLMEVDWLKRIALGTPKLGEGHGPEHKDLVLAIVPWAPLPSGVVALEGYVEMVKERAGESWGKIRGWRYLVQDKQQGTMLGGGVLEGLKWLGRKGWAFDVGVDHHRGGDWQLEETLEMVKRAHEGVAEGEKVAFILGKDTASFLDRYVDISFAQIIYASRI
jgi:L-rhamnono-1,4-lactonase